MMCDGFTNAVRDYVLHKNHSLAHDASIILQEIFRHIDSVVKVRVVNSDERKLGQDLVTFLNGVETKVAGIKQDLATLKRRHQG